MAVSLYSCYSYANSPTGIAALEAGDVEAAAAAFQQAFEAGDGDGAFYLGRMFELRQGTEPDLQQAAALYQAGVDKDSAFAMNRLGLMYLEGQAVLKDYARGAELICDAAEMDEPNAEFNCGMTYLDGRGNEADPAQAAAYWQKASDHTGAHRRDQLPR